MLNTKPADSDAAEAVPSAKSIDRVPWLVLGGLLIADQVTKSWALDALTDPDRNIDLIGSLRFNLVYNTGFAFSGGSGMGRWIGLLAIVVSLFLFRAIWTAESRLVSIPLAMIAAGALGNVLDRLFRGDGFMDGAVIDFIDLQWWPVFNVADMAIVVGGAVLLIFGQRALSD